MTGKPELALDFHHLLCALHSEPFRESWPQGFAHLSVGMINAFVNDPEIEKSTGGDTGLLQLELERRKPLCCRYPVVYRRAYLESGISHRGICMICGRLRPGTSYRVRVGEDDFYTHDHLCIECIEGRAAQIRGGPPV